MKPLLLKINENDAFSFDIRHEKVPYFDNPWHYHPEFELTLVTKSEGVRFIGDSIEPFAAGDLVLLGANLPHYWRNSDHFYTQKPALQAEAIIMRFRLQVWGAALLETPEMQNISNVLKQAELGIHFSFETAEKIKPIMIHTLQTSGIERLTGWLRIFETLATSENFRLLSNKSFAGLNPGEDSDRIARVLAYIQNHLSEPIQLSDVAAIANMNKTAFCRYFKQQTNKTFVDVLNEIRIQSACRLLIESGKDISQIAYECGFQDVPYFNQVFKTKKCLTPTGFRLKQSQNISD